MMGVTTCPGPRISTFPNTVAHAGLKAQLQPLLIDSMFSTACLAPHLLVWTLKLWSTVRLVAHAMVETQLWFMSTPTTMVFPTVHVSSTSPIIWNTSAPIMIFAKIARPQFPRLVMMVLVDAQQYPTRSTTSVSTTQWLVLTRWRPSLPNTDLSVVVFKQPLNSVITRVVSTLKWLQTSSSTTRFQLLVTALLKKVRSTGSAATHGAHTGANTASSRCRCTLITWVSKLTAQLEFPPTTLTSQLLKLINSLNETNNILNIQL